MHGTCVDAFSGELPPMPSTRAWGFGSEMIAVLGDGEDARGLRELDVSLHVPLRVGLLLMCARGEFLRGTVTVERQHKDVSQFSLAGRLSE